MNSKFLNQLPSRIGREAAPLLCLVVLLSLFTTTAWARDIEYKNTEMVVNVTPGEPTQLKFPGEVAGGFKKKLSTLSLDKKETDLVIFASEGLPDEGEAIIVRLKDGRSYSVRVQRSGDQAPRDDIVRIKDARTAVLSDDEEEPPPYAERQFGYAPPNTVSGLMREMILAAEFGKSKVQGYRISDQYAGETVLNDGTLNAKIDRIFIGPNLWGYVIDAENLLDQTQRVNPATFRLDGTKAVSLQNWELAPKPLTAEQQAAKRHTTKIYVITRPRKVS